MDITPTINFFEANTALILLINSIILGINLIILILNISANSKLRKKWKVLLKGNNKLNLEQLLENQTVEVDKISSKISELNDIYLALHEKANKSLKKIGFTRFDAFENVGGEQSFCLALLDTANTGIVITSIIGRTDCRVYCKLIEEGLSNRNTTPEEDLAISSAINMTDAISKKVHLK